MSDEIAADYGATGTAWQAGPGRVYDVLAERMVADTSTDWTGRSVLDVGAGMGAAGRAVERAGGHPVAADFALGMLVASGRRPAVQSDAAALPIATGAVGGYVAAFCLNHLLDPSTALREAGRVVVNGGPIVASAYADDDTHPAKEAVDAAATALGWRIPAWSVSMKADRAPLLSTVPRATAFGEAAGLHELQVEHVTIRFPELTPKDLVAWRLGMAQLAPFVAGLSPVERADLEVDAIARLGDAEPLARRIIVLRATAR